MNKVLSAAGKTTRFGGVAVGVQYVIEAVSNGSTHWGKLIAGSVICAVCLIWSIWHDRNLSK